MRALFVNLRHGGVTQGGSTLTQQLVKNVFLSSERSFFRKVREAFIAVAVEVQHSKKSILQGYLNGIYLGGANGIQYYGFGAAARAYFGKDASELTLPEAAAIAGMIKSPGFYSPLAHPDHARAAAGRGAPAHGPLGWIDAAALARALATPVETAPMRLGDRPAPHFADAMATEARDRFGLRRLGNRGYQPLLDPLDAGPGDRPPGGHRHPAQPRPPGAARRRSARGGADLGRSPQRRHPRLRRRPGLREERVRPRLARPTARPGAASSRSSSWPRWRAASTRPASKLEDTPLTLKAGGRSWTPKNADGEYLGDDHRPDGALEQSRNVPLIRLAMAVGLDKVAATAHRLGIESELQQVPAMALGVRRGDPARGGDRLRDAGQRRRAPRAARARPGARP